MPDVPPQPQRRWLRPARWLVLLIILAFASHAYVRIGGLLITQTNNTDKRILGGDQKHNMKLALQTRADLHPDWSQGVSGPIKNWFPHRTDGVVNPLWPWIAAWLAEDAQQISGETEVTAADRAFFDRGRWFHVGWTLGALLVVAFACARRFTLAGTLNVVLLAGFGALLPRTAYFQPEPLYFALFGCTWFACLMALRKNTLWMHAMIGVLGGLAYLAKSSVEPLLLCYIGISTLRWAWGWIEARRSPPDEATTLWLRRNHWIGLFILGFCYLMTAGPRLAYANEAFGDPFHSYPKYWMWMDDFDNQGYAWMGAHNSKEKLQAVPPAERPSFKNYVATHTGAQIRERLVNGTKAKLEELFWPGYTEQSKKTPKPWKGVLELRGVYLGWLVAVLLGLLIALRYAAPPAAHAAHRMHPETAAMVLFVLGSFIGFSLAYGWYHPIGRGDRFMLSLYAPLVLSLAWGIEGLLRRAHRRNASRWLIMSGHAALWLLNAAILWRVVEILRHPVFKA